MALWWAPAATPGAVKEPASQPSPVDLDIGPDLGLPEEVDASVFDILSDERNTEVYSATLTKQTTTEAPSLIVVLTESDFQRYHFRNVAEALGFVTGIDVIGDHDYFDVGVRGLFGDMNANGSSIKVLVDGVDTVFRTTGQNAFGYDQIPIEAVDRIEVIRGPMSVVFGANAFLGVVNILTKANKESGVKAWARGQTLAKAGEGGGGVRADYVAKKFFVGGSVGYEYQDDSGLVLPSQSFVANEPRFATLAERTTTAEIARHLVANLHAGATLMEGLTLRLDGIFGWTDSSAQFQPYSLLLPANHIATTQGVGQLTLSYVRKWLTVELKGWSNNGATLPNARIDLGISDFTFYRDVGYFAYGGSLRGVFAPSKIFTGWISGEADADSEHMNRVVSVPRGDSLAQGTELTPSNAIPTITNLAIAAHAMVSPIEPINLTVGGRLDHHSVYGDNVSFRAGVVGQLPGIGYAKLLAGQAFKAPTPQQLYWQPLGVADYSGNLSLRRQLADTLELVLGSHALKVVNLQATGFINWVNDRAVYVQRSGRFEAEGIADARSVGIEIEAQLPQLQLAGDKIRLYAQLGFTWQHTTTQLNDELSSLLTTADVLFPDWKGTLLASAEFRPAFLALTARLSVTADRLPSLTNVQVQGGQVAALAGNRDFDLGLRTVALETLSPAKFFKGLAVQLMVRNVLGSAVPYPGYNGFEIPRDPRTLELKLSWQL